MDDNYALLKGFVLRGADVGGHFTMRYTVPTNGAMILDFRVQQGSGNATTHRLGNVSARNLTALVWWDV